MAGFREAERTRGGCGAEEEGEKSEVQKVQGPEALIFFKCWSQKLLRCPPPPTTSFNRCCPHCTFAEERLHHVSLFKNDSKTTLFTATEACFCYPEPETCNYFFFPVELPWTHFLPSCLPTKIFSFSFSICLRSSRYPS